MKSLNYLLVFLMGLFVVSLACASEIQSKNPNIPADDKKSVAKDPQKTGKATGLVTQVMAKSKTICIQAPGKGQMIFSFNKDTRFKNLSSFKDIQANQKVAIEFTISEGAFTASEVSLVLVPLPDGVKKVSTAEMKELIKNINPESGVIIYDTRPPVRYHQAHIPGSISLPSSEGKNEENDKKMIGLLPKDKNRPIIFYCGGPTRGFSANAASLALKNGYTDIRVYSEGFPGWQKADLVFASSPKFVKDENIILIDLRSPQLYEAGHIPRAINFPADKFNYLPESAFPDNKDAPFVLYGDNQAKINTAVEQMRDFNFSKSTFFPGGVERWKKLGNNLEAGSKPSPAKFVYIRKLAPFEVSIDDFKKAIGNKEVLIVDTRSKEEFAMGNIKGAVNIPCDDMPKLYATIPKDKPVYVYCANGARSDVVYEYLKGKGYTNVKLLKATVNFVNNSFTITN